MAADVVGISSYSGTERLTRGVVAAFTAEIPVWAVALTGFLLSVVALWKVRSANREPSLSAPERMPSEGEFLHAMVSGFEQAKQQIVICLVDRGWVFTLAFTTAMCRSRGVNILVVVDAANFHQRYHLLECMGCTVVGVSVPYNAHPFRGMLVDPEDPHSGVGLALSGKPSEGVFAVKYFAPHDLYVLRAAAQSVRRALSEERAGPTLTPRFTPSIQRVSTDELLSRLAGIPAYREAEITFEEISISSTRPTSKVVVKAKLRQANRLIDTFISSNYRLFDPVGISLSNGRVSHLVPPVVEERDGHLQVAEGHSRLYALRKRGIQRVCAVVVRGVILPPPSPKQNWRSVAVTADRASRGKSEYARHIESHTHLDVWPFTPPSSSTLG